MSSGALTQQVKANAAPDAAPSKSGLATQGDQRIANEAQGEFACRLPQASAQRQLQDAANHSAQGRQLKAFQDLAQQSERAKELKSMSAMMNGSAGQKRQEGRTLQAKARAATVQRQAAAVAASQHDTSGPDHRQSGIDETPEQLHERLGHEAQAILSEPPGRDMAPPQALEERTRLARQLEAHFTQELEPGIGMFITVEAGQDPRRGGLLITILIAPNDWKTVFKIAFGIVAVGATLYWMLRGGDDKDGGAARGRDPVGEQQAPDDAQAIEPSIRGLPNRNNDCFLNSIIQQLAGAYPAILSANESMRVEIRGFVRRHGNAIDGGEAAVDALRDALSVEAPDFGALVDLYGPNAIDRDGAIAELITVYQGRAAALRMRGDLLALVQRVNNADPAQIGPQEVQELRAQLVEHQILAAPVGVGGPATQEDSHEVLNSLLELFAPRDGNRIAVSKRITILTSEADPAAAQGDVADFLGGVLERPEAPEPTLLVPLADHDNLLDYLNATFGGDGVGEDADMRARNDGIGVHITRQQVASRFTQLPQVLTIVLQRSLPNGDKEDKRFGMPELLTLLEGDPPSRRKRFRLVSTVYHQGGGGKAGHYWAHRRHHQRWQHAEDRYIRVDRQPGGEGGERDLPHDINHGYIYSYALEVDQPYGNEGVEVATGEYLDPARLPPALVGGAALGSAASGGAVTRRGTSSAPRASSPPKVDVGTPVELPARQRGVDEDPLVIGEVMAAAAKLGALGIVPMPPSTLVLRDPRLPTRQLSIEVVLTDPGSDGDPMWVGPGEAHPQLMVSNRAELSGARDWFAMAIDRIRQGALAGLRYKSPIEPKGPQPEPLGGTRVLKDQLIDRDAVPRHMSTVHATLADWLPGRIASEDEDDRLLCVTMAYAAQLELTQAAAANLVQELSELWLSFNPGLVSGEDDLIGPLVRQLWQQLPPLADARTRQRVGRVGNARVIPAGERERPTVPSTVGSKAKPEAEPKAEPKAAPEVEPKTGLAAEPKAEPQADAFDSFLLSFGSDDEPTPEVVNPRAKFEPAYLMDPGYEQLYAVLAADGAGAHAQALLASLRTTSGVRKQAARKISALLHARPDVNATPSTVDGPGAAATPNTVDGSAPDEAALALEPFGLTAPKAGDAGGTVPGNAGHDPSSAVPQKLPADVSAVLNKLPPDVLGVFATFLEIERDDLDVSGLTGRERKARVQKTLPTPADIDTATDSFFISPADAEMLQNLLGFHTAARLISYYRANNAIVSIRALVGQLRKLAPALAEAAWPPLTGTSLVLDTNVVKALLLDVKDLSREERAVRRKALALFEQLNPSDLRLPNMVLGELSAFGPGVIAQLQAAVRLCLGTDLPCYGVPLKEARDNASRTGKYAADLIAMEEAQVGGDKGAPDRGLVADTIHAMRAQGAGQHPDQATRLITADLGIVKHLRKKHLGAEHHSDTDPQAPRHFTTARLSGNIDVYPIDIPEELRIHASEALASADGGNVELAKVQPDLEARSPPEGLARGVFERPIGPASPAPDVPVLRVHHLIELIRSDGGEVVVTGGAVRDAVRGVAPNDVDLTCTLTLARLDALIASHERFAGLGREQVRLRGLRLLKLATGKNAIDITCADEGESKTLDEPGLAHDATKRDFRMNALYLDAAGKLHDPTGEGVADALEKRLVLVADKFFGDLMLSNDPPFEEIGRSLKFVGRDYQMSEEQQTLLRQAYLTLIERARGQEATEVADTVRMLEKAREKTPIEIMQTMIKLGFSEPAIRALFPDSVAGLAADRTPAFERNVVPRRLDNPATEAAVVAGAAPQVKIDEEHGSVYQYRVFVRTEDPEERLMIDIDFTDHDLPGHRAQHHHIYRWKPVSKTWDKHIAGLSKTGQPGRPDLDGDLYRGPRPWLVEKALGDDAQVDVKLLVAQLNKGLEGFSYQAALAGELIDLGGELLLHPAKLRQMQGNGTLARVFMLVENVVTRGKMPPPQDESLDELTKTGGERLRFGRHLADVDMMLDALGVAGEPLFAQLAIASKIRLYDLMVAWRRDATVLDAALRSALARKPASVEQLVELCEANLALAEQKADEPDKVLDRALEAGQDQAPAVLSGASRGELRSAIRAAAVGGLLKFATPSAAAYHWLKHGAEFGPSGSTRETFGLGDYVAAVNGAIAMAEESSVEVEQSGATAFVFVHKDGDDLVKAVVKVGNEGAQIATCFRRTARPRQAELPRLPRPEALERLGRVTTLVKAQPASPSVQMDRLVLALEAAVANAQGAEGDEQRAAIVHLVDWARKRVNALPDVAAEQIKLWHGRLDQVLVLATVG